MFAVSGMLSMIEFKLDITAYQILHDWRSGFPVTMRTFLAAVLEDDSLQSNETNSDMLVTNEAH